MSLGDSYSVGYQPVGGSTPGYTVVVAKATRLALVNFGCGGATTSSLVSSIGCPDILPHTAGGVTYPTTTQEAAALSFLNAHKGHIGLITVSIGGNDVTSCASQSNPISCVATAVSGITKNVTGLAAALRTAAGPKVPLIGLTYPDVILGTYVYPTHPAGASAVSLAKLSVVAFKSLINPALTKAYGSANGSLVDVTKATGAYVPLTRTVHSRTYGTIPAAVGERLHPHLVLRPGEHPRHDQGLHPDRQARGGAVRVPAPVLSSGVSRARERGRSPSRRDCGLLPFSDDGRSS